MPFPWSAGAYNLHTVPTNAAFGNFRIGFFSKCAIRNKFVLDSLALSGEPSKQALGKVAQSGATQFAKILLTAQFRRSLDRQAYCIG
jgi:hypothetical protein